MFNKYIHFLLLLNYLYYLLSLML